MGLKSFLGVTIAAGVLFSAPASLSARPAGDAAAGKEVFLKKCKTCHGDDGQGNQGMAKLLKTTITPLDSEEVQSKSDAELKKIITEGKDKMKPVKDVGGADLDNVIAFVRSLKKK
jgi:mono/diheme cytochrome c family protein